MTQVICVLFVKLYKLSDDGTIFECAVITRSPFVASVTSTQMFVNLCWFFSLMGVCQ